MVTFPAEDKRPRAAAPRSNPTPPVVRNLKELSARSQLVFDFFGGGKVSIAFQHQNAVNERLFEAAKAATQTKEAMSILCIIYRYLGWQSYECTKIAAELCEITQSKAPNMTRALKLLDEVGAIRPVN